MCACVCVCVCERERECVCVCERERERERERVSERVRESKRETEKQRQSMCVWAEHVCVSYGVIDANGERVGVETALMVRSKRHLQPHSTL